MPNKTIYIRDEDVPVFEKASVLFGKSLSRVIADALRRLVAREESRKVKNEHGQKV